MSPANPNPFDTLDIAYVEMGCDRRVAGDTECADTSMKFPRNMTIATVCMGDTYVAFCESDGRTGDRIANCADRCVIHDHENRLRYALLITCPGRIQGLRTGPLTEST